MRGWFDAFRTDGGPTLYSYSNRTPVTGDFQTITFYIVFVTLFVAFIIIFPGIRKERFTTFTSVTLSLFVGTVILVSNYSSQWHVAEATIASSYRAFSKQKIMADIGVYIGLEHVNITLHAMPIHNQSGDIDFNERFYWITPTQIHEEYIAALVKGLPYPILTVAEYLSLDIEGFCWGREYRNAGYYASILLWSSFALWMLMNTLLMFVPRYGAYSMTLTGTLMLFTNFIYYCLLPKRPLAIRFEDTLLHFRFGWCYWLVLIAGAMCVGVGLIVSIVDLIFPQKFSTILEVDYDTPYDRHIIIEDSHDTKKNKNKRPRLEEPPISKLFRRASKRERYDDRYGIDNGGFQMEIPSSPWRYPHLMFERDTRKSTKAVNFSNRDTHKTSNRLELPPIPGFGDPTKHLQRTDSKESTCSSISSVNGCHSQPTKLTVPTRKDSKLSGKESKGSKKEEAVNTSPVPSFQDQFKHFNRQDSQQSNSSGSSMGLSILSRTNSKHSDIERPRANASVLERMDSTHSDLGTRLGTRPSPRYASFVEKRIKDDSGVIKSSSS